MRRDSRVCVEAAGQSRDHRRIQHPSAFCLSIGLSGRLKRGTDQFGTACTYILVGCYTFPTTLDDVPLCGPGQQRPPEDAPLPSLGEVVEEDCVDGNVEDGDLPRFEADVEDQPWEGDPGATERAKIAYDSWMKLVEQNKQVQVKTLTFAEVITSRATGPRDGRFGQDLLEDPKLRTASSTAICGQSQRADVQGSAVMVS